MTQKTFFAMLAAGAVFIAIGIAASIYAGTAVEVPLDHTLGPGLTDEITPEMDAGNRMSIQVQGSTFDFTVRDPDGNPLVSVTDQEDFRYELTTEKAGRYRVTIENTGDSDVFITGTTHTKAGSLGFTAPMMLIITGTIVVGLSLRFRRR